MENTELKSASRVLRDDDLTGQYDFIALIGRGSFGSIFLVRGQETGELCAMKYVKRGKGKIKNSISKMKKELDILSKLEHPFIIKVSGSSVKSDRGFLLLDYCPGGDLLHLLQIEKTFSEERYTIY